ncbi:unnamed protein product, partial [Staurois parvus]
WVPVPPPIAPTLPCATLRPPIGAARPQIGHGPPYRLVTLLLGPQCDLGPCTASHCSTLPCATLRSPHTPAGFHFVIGCCMASHCCCLHPPHCGSKHWFWPRDWPNE